jgi:hypothetical protein
MWKRYDGRVYIICSGPANKCEVLRRIVASLKGGGIDLSVYDDIDGSIAKAFLVNRTPATITIDERGRVEKYGFLIEPRIDIPG